MEHYRMQLWNLVVCTAHTYQCLFAWRFDCEVENQQHLCEMNHVKHSQESKQIHMDAPPWRSIFNYKTIRNSSRGLQKTRKDSSTSGGEQLRVHTGWEYASLWFGIVARSLKGDKNYRLFCSYLHCLGKVHRHFGRSNAREENAADRAQLTDCKCGYALYKMADAHDTES